MWPSIKLFGKDILIETIAVFIGITLALIIDNAKDTNQSLTGKHNYFGLMETQLIRDTLFLTEMKPDMEKQHMSLDSVISDNRQIQLLQKVEQTFIYEPPIELLNSLLTSNSFNSIYDSTIFNALSSQLRDFKLYLNIQQKTDEARKNFIYTYIDANKDPQSGRLEIEEVVMDNRMTNELIHLNDLYKARYMTLLSIQINYRVLLKQIAQRIHGND